MTFVKRKINKNHHKFIQLFPKASRKSFRVSVPGIGHSDIRGFREHLFTNRSMVRRELYRLKAWITKVPTKFIRR